MPAELLLAPASTCPGCACTSVTVVSPSPPCDTVLGKPMVDTCCGVWLGGTEVEFRSGSDGAGCEPIPLLKLASTCWASTSLGIAISRCELWLPLKKPCQGLVFCT